MVSRDFTVILVLMIEIYTLKIYRYAYKLLDNFLMSILIDSASRMTEFSYEQFPRNVEKRLADFH